MPILIDVKTRLDQKSATADANHAARLFAKAGEDAGRAFGKQLADSAGESDAAIKKSADRAKDAYDRVADAAGRVRSEEARMQDIRDKGANDSRIISQAEKLEKARRAESRAIRDAVDSYRDYERAAASAGSAAEDAGKSFSTGLRGAAAAAGSAGQDAANDFASGFAGASTLMRLGAAGGPVGLALAGVAALGAVAGQQLAGAIADGMATQQMQDMFQARMGLDDTSMARYADAAGSAFANNFGTSVADNLATAQVALQSGIINTSTTDAQVQQVVQQLQGVSSATDATTAEISRSVATLMRTGLAGSVSQASDIIVSGFQRGLDVSNDFLDTLNEYSTQFRSLGLDAGQFMTLLHQGLEGGARDTDVVADSIKEFSIRAVDGSKLTAQGFEALGLNATQMGQMFAAGGAQAQSAFGVVLTALQSLQDPQQKALAWQALFGTQWEDMKGAVNGLSLDPAKAEFTDLAGVADRSTKTASDNFMSNWETATRTVGQWFANLKTDMADWFTDLPVVKDIPGMITDIFDGDNPGGPIPFAGAKPGTPIHPLDVIPGLTAPGPAPTPGAGGLLMPSLTGPPPPTGAVPAAPTPGAPKPIDPASSGTTTDKPVIDVGRYSLDRIPIGAFQGLNPGQGPATAAPMGAPGATVWNPAEQGYGTYEVDPQKVFDANTALISQKQSVESARARLLELEATNTATAGDINAAKTAVITTERSYLSEQAKLAEAQQGTWKKLTDGTRKLSSGINDLGAAVDPDLGLSNGLPGLVENLTKLALNFALAPVLGPLWAQAHAGDLSGSTAASVSIPGAQAMGPAALQPGAYPGDAALLSHVPATGTYDNATKDLSRGLADCSSGVEDLVNIMDGKSTVGGSLWTGNAASVLPQMGFQRGMGGLGDFRVGYNDHHMQATLPGGTPFNYGAESTIDQGGVGGAGADDPAFTDHWYRPAGGAAGGPASTAAGPMPGMSSNGQFPVPLPVTIVGGMTGGPLGGPPIGTPASGQGAGPAPGPPSFGLSQDQWNSIVGAEASGNWGANTGNGFYGGPQFTQSTWDANGGQSYAPRADLATPQQQMDVGNRVLASQGAGAWPTTSAAHPDWFVPGSPTPAGLYSPANTSPGLNNPPPPVGGGGLPGTGAPQATPAGMAYPTQGGPGFQGIGGLPLAAASAALSPIPGAQAGMQLANRAIAFAGQSVGIGVSGLLETLSVGDNPMGSLGNSWFGKLASGFAGARPAVPNKAGQAPPNPNGQGGGQGQAGQSAGNTFNTTVNNQRATENGTGKDLTRHLDAMYSQPGKQ